MLNLTHNLKMQIKTNAKYHLSSFRSAQIIKLDNILSWGRQKKIESHMFLTKESLRFVIISQNFLNACILWCSCFTLDNLLTEILLTRAQRCTWTGCTKTVPVVKLEEIKPGNNLEINWKKNPRNKLIGVWFNKL